MFHFIFFHSCQGLARALFWLPLFQNNIIRDRCLQQVQAYHENYFYKIYKRNLPGRLLFVNNGSEKVTALSPAVCNNNNKKKPYIKLKARCIFQILLFCAAVATAQASLIGTRIVAPGYLNVGLIAPAAVKTSSVVTIPGSFAADKRIIGAGMLAAAPMAPAVVVSPSIIGNGVIPKGLYGAAPLGVLSPLGLKGAGIIANGLYGAAPLGVLSPFGLKGYDIIAAPGIGKAIL